MVTEQLTAGALLRAKRLQLGLSARALSAQAGQSDSYVTRVESGAIEPSLRAFARLSRVLGLTPHEIELLLEVAAK